MSATDVRKNVTKRRDFGEVISQSQPFEARLIHKGGFDKFLVLSSNAYITHIFPLLIVRTSLIPCDSNHLAKNLSIPLVNQWPALQPYNNKEDVKLFRRSDSWYN